MPGELLSFVAQLSAGVKRFFPPGTLSKKNLTWCSLHTGVVSAHVLESWQQCIYKQKEQAMAETIREAYIRRNSKSAALYPKFREVFPTGVSHDMRVTDPFPLVMAMVRDRASGMSMATSILTTAWGRHRCYSGMRIRRSSRR